MKPAPSAAEESSRTNTTWRAATPIVGFIALGLFLFGLVLLANIGYGSVRAAIGYYLRSETVLCDSAVKSVRITDSVDKVEVRFKLANRGARAVRILGCETSCACMLPDDLPFDLQPTETRSILFTIATKTRGGTPRFSKPVVLHLTLFTNNPEQSRIPLTINCGL
jgi:hypothetical protein